MKKLYIALQAPTVEMKIKSEPDCTGKVETLTAVFLRHNTEEAEKLRQRMSGIQNKVYVGKEELTAEELRLREYFNYLPKVELEEQVEEGKTQFLVGKIFIESAEALQAARDKQQMDLRNLMRSQLVALKNVPLDVQETDEAGKVSVSRMTVADTRHAVDNEELWGEAKNCLPELVDLLLLSNPWSSALAKAQQNVLYNLQLLTDASSKN